MAETVISVCLQPLCNSVYKQAEQQLTPICGFKKEAGKLMRELPAIEEAISKAEKIHLQAIQAALLDDRRLEDEASVRDWLHSKLKDVYYDIDDLVDKWKTADLIIPKVVASKKVCLFVPSPSFRRLRLHREIAFKIKEVNNKLRQFKDDKDLYDLNTTTGAIENLRQKTASLVDGSKVYGRHEEKTSLIRELLADEGVIKTIPIVGMGGIGKTTLAQLVYNDAQVMKEFPTRIWVSVPYSFDLTKITKAIIEKIENAAPNLDELESLLRRVHISLEGKRFLLVLDDIWDVDKKKWEDLNVCLKNGDPRSKILVTTQKEGVASMMGTHRRIYLEELSEDACWSMLNAQSLEKLQDIASKYRGLPLLVKSLENFMHYGNNSIQQWEKFLLRSRVFVPYLLSYYDLSSLHRRCFSYCCVLPKDYEIERDDLIELWRSQGLLGHDKECEPKGLECFEILATRCLFRDLKKEYNGNILKCKMHDIVHDFSHFLMKHECFKMEVPATDEPNEEEETEKVRHVTILLKTSQAQIPTSTRNQRHCRTLFVMRSEASTHLSCDFLINLTCLRTLRLQCCNIEELPEDIDKLTHLRYLNLSYNGSLSKLPDTLCSLFNLQTLRLKGCVQLQSLPGEMGNLVKLQQLYVEGCNNLEALPKGIGRLTSLETLDMFIVPSPDQPGNSETLKLEDLLQLSKLQRHKIHVFRCGNLIMDDDRRTLRSQLENEGLVDTKLNFQGSTETGSIQDGDILEALQPHLKLKSLELRGGRSITAYPNWLILLTSLKRLVLSGCQNCVSLPPLGRLSSLESLQIDDMSGLQNIGPEFLGIGSDNSERKAFGNLKELQFSQLCNWKKWGSTSSGGAGAGEEEKEIMPHLASLQISDCNNLEVLPSFLRQLQFFNNLTIDKCNILKECCEKKVAEIWDKISHISHIKIDEVTIK